MLPVHQAESIILELIQPLHPQRDAERVDLRSAPGRILASVITSALDFPHWDNSAMDGYAVRFEDVQNNSVTDPVVLEIIEEIPAGCQPQFSIQPGQAARIFTGACLPQGADTIVIQEDTRRQDNSVVILTTPQPQAFVRHQGSYYRAGEPLLTPGTLIGAPEMAVLAAAQCTEIIVYRKPRVAIFSTGDELVTPDQPLQPGQLVDSNQYALTAWVEKIGGEAIPLGIVRDQPEALATVITEAMAMADVVISTGGVSVGDYDYVEEILERLGGEIVIRSVAVKPGKPLTVAKFAEQDCVYFGVPGNPVSALVSCWRFVQPALQKLAGFSNWVPVLITARTSADLLSDGKRELYLWGQLQIVDGNYQFYLSAGQHNSGNLINLAGTTGLAVVPVGTTFIPQGEFVSVLQV